MNTALWAVGVTGKDSQLVQKKALALEVIYFARDFDPDYRWSRQLFL